MSVALKDVLNLVGRLDDTPGEDTARERFRAFLQQNIRDVGQLQDYVEECLRNTGEQYNRALQDLVNHLGSLLGFSVTYGRYQGVPGQIGFDGHWESPTGFHVVVEVKTTQIYPIKTATLIGYIDHLISEQRIPSWDHALGLYVIGLPDATISQLENSIIAEHRSQQLRTVSVASLLTLADLQTEHDVSHVDVLALIRPSGPSIDPVISLLSGLVEPPPPEPVAPDTEPAAAETDNDDQLLLSTPETAYWLTSVRSNRDVAADRVVETLVGQERVYVFGEKTPGRRRIKPGDWICFYATGKGIVGHARVASTPEYRPHPKVPQPERYPWTFRLDDTHVYTDSPVVLDSNLRPQLGAFKGRDPKASWSWFVQATHEITKHDFDVLTGQA